MSLEIGFQRHDHRRCMRQAMQDAEQLCERLQLRLTPLRRRVLEMIWQNHQPSGAYSLLDQLAAETDTRPAPPTVYRALEFLQEHGLVHRLASLNAYVGCPHPADTHRGLFLICKQCETAVEIADPAVIKALDTSAKRQDFEIEQEWVEVLGICAKCRRA